jgi:hypothetical protein
MPMPLRPNVPMQRGYGPRMMPPRYHGGMPNMGFNQAPQMGAFSPRMAKNQGNKGGGLLAKILGKDKQQQGGFQGAIPSMSRSAPSGGVGLLKSLTNPESLSGFLNNTQNVLKTAQQFGPVIQQFQQYAPLVKNLPSLWKLYRGLKDATSEDGDSVTTESEPNVKEDTEEPVESVELTETKKPINESFNRTERNLSKAHPSVPKLYI